MSLRPEEINHDFQRRLMEDVELGMPPGQAPDLCRFPDRALAMSGWTLGLYHRVDCMTGKVLRDGEESLLEQQRRAAAEIIARERAATR